MKDYIKTSDYTYAAYLMLNDYTLIACVDPENGENRYDFYLTHSDDDIRENIVDHSARLRDNLEGTDRSYKVYWKHIKKLRKMTYDPIKKSQMGAK